MILLTVNMCRIQYHSISSRDPSGLARDGRLSQFNTAHMQICVDCRLYRQIIDRGPDQSLWSRQAFAQHSIG